MKKVTVFKTITGIAILAAISMVFINISADNIREDLSKNASVRAVSQDELLKLLSQDNFSDNYALIDIRTPLEYKISKIPSAINIPHYKILNDISLLDAYKDKEMILYCHSGVRVGKVTKLLTELKYSNLSHLTGDMSGWKANDFPVE